jgi:hypothetical protein
VTRAGRKAVNEHSLLPTSSIEPGPKHRFFNILLGGLGGCDDEDVETSTDVGAMSA